MNWVRAIQELKTCGKIPLNIKHGYGISRWNPETDEGWIRYKAARQSVPEWFVKLLYKFKLL